MDFQIGEIYWLISDQEISHPHVIINNHSLNINNTLVVCSLTTNMNKINIPGNILLDLNEGDLDKKSIVEVSKETVINKSKLGKYIGRLSIERVNQIIQRIGFINRSFLDTDRIIK